VASPPSAPERPPVASPPSGPEPPVGDGTVEPPWPDDPATLDPPVPAFVPPVPAIPPVPGDDVDVPPAPEPPVDEPFPPCPTVPPGPCWPLPVELHAARKAASDRTVRRDETLCKSKLLPSTAVPSNVAAGSQFLLFLSAKGTRKSEGGVLCDPAWSPGHHSPGRDVTRSNPQIVIRSRGAARPLTPATWTTGCEFRDTFVTSSHGCRRFGERLLGTRRPAVHKAVEPDGPAVGIRGGDRRCPESIAEAQAAFR